MLLSPLPHLIPPGQSTFPFVVHFLNMNRIMASLLFVFAFPSHLFREGLPWSNAGRGSASTCPLLTFISYLDQPHLLSELIVFS